MTEHVDADQKAIERRFILFLHLAIGLSQGLVFWIVYSEWRAATQPAGFIKAILSLFSVDTTYPFLALISTFAAVAGVVLQFAWTGKDRGRAYLLSLLTGILYAFVAFWVFLQIPTENAPFRGDEHRVATLNAALFISLYILLPYIQMFQKSGKLSFPYAGLFEHSWNNFFIASIACIFTGVYWGLIALWGKLFELVGIKFFSDIFFTAPFAFISTFTVFGTGLMLGKELHSVILTLRNIALIVFKTLMPLLSFIALLFLLVLPFTGLKPLWDTKMSSVVTLTLLYLTVLFINSVFQDGNSKPPYIALIRKVVEGMLLAMPVYSAITVYSIWLRVGQHGFTPDRVYALIFALIAGFYGMGYAFSIFRRSETWIGFIRPVNIIASLSIVLVALLLHTPILDPVSISVSSQSNRLTGGKIDAEDFDYEALRFQMGRKGYAKLKELAEIKNHAQADLIRTNAAQALNASDNGFHRSRTPRQAKAEAGEELMIEHLRIMTPSGDIPAGLFDAIKTTLLFDGNILPVCARKKDCAVFAMDMDDDAEEEYFFVPSEISLRAIILFDKATGNNCKTGENSWSYIGKMETNTIIDRQELIEALKGSKLVTAQPKYKNLKGDKWEFRLK